MKEWSGTRSGKRCEKSGDQVLASIYCYNQFHLSLDMAPKQQTWAQHVSWPPSHQVCLRHGKLSEVVSRLILKLREVVPLAWETIYSLGEVMRVTSMGLPDLGLKSVTEV